MNKDNFENFTKRGHLLVVSLVNQFDIVEGNTYITPSSAPASSYKHRDLIHVLDGEGSPFTYPLILGSECKIVGVFTNIKLKNAVR